MACGRGSAENRAYSRVFLSVLRLCHPCYPTLGGSPTPPKRPTEGLSLDSPAYGCIKSFMNGMCGWHAAGSPARPRAERKSSVLRLCHPCYIGCSVRVSDPAETPDRRSPSVDYSPYGCIKSLERNVPWHAAGPSGDPRPAQVIGAPGFAIRAIQRSAAVS